MNHFHFNVPGPAENIEQAIKLCGQNIFDMALWSCGIKNVLSCNDYISCEISSRCAILQMVLKDDQDDRNLMPFVLTLVLNFGPTFDRGLCDTIQTIEETQHGQFRQKLQSLRENRITKPEELSIILLKSEMTTQGIERILIRTRLCLSEENPKRLENVMVIDHILIRCPDFADWWMLESKSSP